MRGAEHRASPRPYALARQESAQVSGLRSPVVYFFVYVKTDRMIYQRYFRGCSVSERRRGISRSVDRCNDERSSLNIGTSISAP